MHASRRSRNPCHLLSRSALRLREYEVPVNSERRQGAQDSKDHIEPAPLYYRRHNEKDGRDDKKAIGERPPSHCWSSRFGFHTLHRVCGHEIERFARLIFSLLLIGADQMGLPSSSRSSILATIVPAKYMSVRSAGMYSMFPPSEPRILDFPDWARNARKSCTCSPSGTTTLSKSRSEEKFLNTS